MIDKQDFYHGAAILRVVEDARCRSVNKLDIGFLVNQETFVYLKYRTKSRTPWNFQFGSDEIEHLNSTVERFPKIVIAFICGGDGICGLSWLQVKELIANNAGWISCSRKFNEQYGVSGPNGNLKGKVSLQQWPNIVFDE
ncbi:MAG: hypothetical protein ABSC77_03630 [Terracidiphilus sp.]|jgi:hypothetical protein